MKCGVQIALQIEVSLELARYDVDDAPDKYAWQGVANREFRPAVDCGWFDQPFEVLVVLAEKMEVTAIAFARRGKDDQRQSWEFSANATRRLDILRRHSRHSEESDEIESVDINA